MKTTRRRSLLSLLVAETHVAILMFFRQCLCCAGEKAAPIRPCALPIIWFSYSSVFIAIIGGSSKLLYKPKMFWKISWFLPPLGQEPNLSNQNYIYIYTYWSNECIFTHDERYKVGAVWSLFEQQARAACSPKSLNLTTLQYLDWMATTPHEALNNVPSGLVCEVSTTSWGLSQWRPLPLDNVRGGEFAAAWINPSFKL